MKLLESIASYSGESRRNIQQVLNDDVKNIIAKLVKKPETILNIDNGLLNELIGMDILTYREGQIKPNTAVFFEEDIEKLYNPVFTLGEKLAEILKVNGEDLKNCSPNIKNLLLLRH